ncbi:MAG: hypothetical protein GOU98_02120 [Candidatus Altiarchaeota archaeon]|nr:hypothetical protein [Candidatus Altiarchaeota archaeon]
MLSGIVIDFSKKGSVSKKIVSPKLKLYEAAKIMIESSLDSLKVDGVDKSIDINSIIFQLKNTPELAKREAKTVMGVTPLVFEKNISNIQNVASSTNLAVLPIVNEQKKLIGTWFNGRMTKKPLIVKTGTRVKLIVEKVLETPVIVVDKHRNPVGTIDKRDLLELAASYQEYTVPIFYSGVEDLSEVVRIKELVDDTITKVNKLIKVVYSSVHVSKRGVWVSHIKISTTFGTFISSCESTSPLSSVKESLLKILNEVKHNKDKRTRLRQ